MSDIAAVDLIPPQAPEVEVPQPPPLQPYTPPSNQQKPPPMDNVAKEFAKIGVPVTQETVIKQTVGPTASMNAQQSFSREMLNATGTTGKSKSMIEYMAAIFLDSACQDWTIQVDRISPPRTPDGTPLAVGPVQTISPPIPYPDVYERIRSLNGGGKYALRILDATGVSKGTIQFQIDCIQNPPIPNIPGNGMGYRVVGGPHTTSTPFGSGFGGGDDEIAKARQAEQLARANKSRIVAEYEAEETQQIVQKRRQQAAEAEERRMGSSFETQAKLESERIFSVLKSELKEMQYINDRRMDQMQQNFEKLLLTLNNGTAGKNDSANMMLMMGEMFKGMSASTTAMVTAVLASNNKGDSGQATMMETMKMINASNEKVAQMAMASARESSAKSETLVQTLLTSRLKEPDNILKQALDMREAGYKQAMEMLDWVERVKGDREPDEVINPESGFWSNLGNVVLSGLQGLVSKGGKGAGSMALGALAQMLNKPQGTTQFSNDELKRVADQIVAQELQKRGIVTPPPAVAPQLPPPQAAQPRPQQRRLDPRKLFDRVYEINGAAPAAPTMPPQPVAQPIQQPQPVAQPQMVQPEEFEEVMPQPVAQPIPIQQEIIPPQPVVADEEENFDEEQGDEDVNEMIEMVLDDLSKGRKEHNWVDFALNKFGAEILQQMADAPRNNEYDISAHIAILQQNSDPALFAKLYEAVVTGPNSKEYYARFVENFIEFIEGIKEDATA